MAIKKEPATDPGKFAILILNDWDGLRASIIAGLKRLGRDIPIIPEDARGNYDKL